MLTIALPVNLGFKGTVLIPLFHLLILGDLASRTLVLESKRFYLDVKENTRGRFIKIAEISADGRKNQILMTLPTAG